jgi:hypothetical protein
MDVSLLFASNVYFYLNSPYSTILDEAHYELEQIIDSILKEVFFSLKIKLIWFKDDFDNNGFIGYEEFALGLLLPHR